VLTDFLVRAVGIEKQERRTDEAIALLGRLAAGEEVTEDLIREGLELDALIPGFLLAGFDEQLVDWPAIVIAAVLSRHDPGQWAKGYIVAAGEGSSDNLIAAIAEQGWLFCGSEFEQALIVLADEAPRESLPEHWEDLTLLVERARGQIATARGRLEGRPSTNMRFEDGTETGPVFPD
jgi:hypothetical protein